MHEPPRRLSSYMDYLGLTCLSLLLLSPLIFKVRIAKDIVVHPFMPLLAGAWCWTAWAALRSCRPPGLQSFVKWNILTPPVMLMGLVIAGLAFSLALNSLRTGAWQVSGWLLLVKGLLYLAPLPFTALLVIRNGSRVMRLFNLVIPPVALLTVSYSFFRFLHNPAIAFMASRSDSEPRYFVMGTFGEVWSQDGLVLRTDTVSQGAYGMYLALVLLLSIALALLKGLDAGLPRWYTRGQALLVCPAAVPAILYTGSRTSLILLAGMLLSFFLLLLWRGADVLAGPGVRRFVLLLLTLIVLSSLMISHYAPQEFPTVQRLAETADGNLELERSALGTFYPLTDAPRKSALRNVESRVWLWGKAIRYLADHPSVLLTGIGNDRKRFLEEVVGLAYTGDLVHFQTAHNLFLDVLIKGGLIALIPLLVACVWLLRTAVEAVTSPMFHTKFAGVAGIGWVMLSFWPPFLVINLVGEEMFTDNLQLHWTMLFGLLLGMFSLAVSSSEWVEGRQMPRVKSESLEEDAGVFYSSIVSRCSSPK